MVKIYKLKSFMLFFYRMQLGLKTSIFNKYQSCFIFTLDNKCLFRLWYFKIIEINYFFLLTFKFYNLNFGPEQKFWYVITNFIEIIMSKRQNGNLK